jgi:NAD(P)H dehydrogenase (quinone)
MIKVAIVYQSGGGHTQVLAESIAQGVAATPGAEAKLIRIQGKQIINGRWDDPAIMEQLEKCDAIVFGCATYMGSASAIYKAFLEKAFDPWLGQKWKDKIAAGFTNSASQNGDKLSTLIQLSIFAAQMGMLWVGVGDPPGNNWSGGSTKDVNRLGSWLGAMGQSNGDQGPDIAPSRSAVDRSPWLGRRVAGVTLRWTRRGEYETERIAAR